MKKIFMLAIVVASMFSFVACGDAKKEVQEEASETIETIDNAHDAISTDTEEMNKAGEIAEDVAEDAAEKTQKEIEKARDIVNEFTDKAVVKTESIVNHAKKSVTSSVEEVLDNTKEVFENTTDEPQKAVGELESKL